MSKLGKKPKARKVEKFDAEQFANFSLFLFRAIVEKDAIIKKIDMLYSQLRGMEKLYAAEQKQGGDR